MGSTCPCRSGKEQKMSHLMAQDCRASARRAYPRAIAGLLALALLLYGTLLGATFAGASGSQPSWSELQPSASPSARSRAGMAFDAASGQLVLFGGADSSSVLGDTWTWDGSNWTQAQPSTSPPAREWASMAHDPATRQLVLFGGLSAAGRLGDTWTWDGSTWTQQSPVHAPPARDAAGMTFDAATSQFLLFGGFVSAGNYLADTWTYVPVVNVPPSITPTDTPTNTPTATATSTPTNTPTATPGPKKTRIPASTPTATPVPTLDAPRSLKATTASRGAAGVNLSWQAPPGMGGKGITGYNVYRGTSSGNESTTPIAVNVTGTTYLDAATVSGTKYFYQVRAVAGTTVGLLSNEASATAG